MNTSPPVTPPAICCPAPSALLGNANAWLSAPAGPSKASDDRPSGFVLPCGDESAFAHVVAVSKRQAPPSQRASQDPERQKRAHHVACQVAKELGGDERDIFVFCRQRADMAHFGVRIGGQPYFGKALLSASTKPWPEKTATVWASSEGFGLPVKPTPTLPHVLLTEWVPSGALCDADMQSTERRRALLRRIRSIHDAPCDEGAALPPNDIVPKTAYLPQLQRKKLSSPLNLVDLQARVEWIKAQFLQLPIKPSFVHGDVALPNITFHREQFFFIDWESTGPGDAFRDPGRLVSYAQWDNEKILLWLESYLGHAPTSQEARHFALVVAEFDMGHFANVRQRAEFDEQECLDRAKRVARGIDVLPDMPKVRLTVADPE